ncbi:hypothetical protein MCN98_07730 [Flavobacteriaceae bacterium LSUCC0859]|nr:hypothetical protein [Flavobacteriaceae bacterium LSUCC0859]
MNQVLFYILFIAALGLAAYNAYLIDYSDFMAEENFVAIVSGIAALAAAVLLLILNLSKKIEAKTKA